MSANRVPAKGFVQLLLLAIVLMATAEARKSYVIKEMIEQGKLKVHSPRVMASDAKWCYFSDANNDFCIEGDLNWKLESKTQMEYKADTQLGVPPHYNHTFIYQSTQSGAWLNRFNLKKLYFNQLTYTMSEFTVGAKFSFYYWINEYAVCLNMALFITPTNFNLISATKLEKCEKTLIKSLDDWNAWTDKEELLIGTCSLSSSEDITVYQYKAFESEYTRYYIGNDTYMNNYCFPGHTPLYSWFLKYPNNPFYAVLRAFLDLQMSFKTAFDGLPGNNKAFEGPTGAPTWSSILDNFVSSWTRDIGNYISALSTPPPPPGANIQPIV